MTAAPVQGNRLIAMLPERQRELLRPHLEPVRLLKKAVLTRGNQPITAAYFLDSGVAAATWSGLPERPIDVFMVGRGGMVGMPLILGVKVTPFQLSMLTAGSALRIDADTFTRVLADNADMRAHFLRFVAYQLMVLAQTATCNAVHPIRARLPFWLLRCQDQLGAPDLPISHQALGHMLGVRRAGVTVAIHALEAQGAVQNTHSHIRIVHRETLLKESCACYRALQRQSKIALGYSMAAADEQALSDRDEE